MIEMSTILGHWRGYARSLASMLNGSEHERTAQLSRRSDMTKLPDDDTTSLGEELIRLERELHGQEDNDTDWRDMMNGRVANFGAINRVQLERSEALSK